MHWTHILQLTGAQCSQQALCLMLSQGTHSGQGMSDWPSSCQMQNGKRAVLRQACRHINLST